jgi:chemotaxis protein CheZ
MPAAAHDPSLSARLDDARREAEAPLTRDDVAAIIADVIGSMEGDISALDLKIYQELEALSRYIQSAKAELAEIRADRIGQEYILSATDELDAVVNATEEATGQILDAAETIQMIAEGLDDPARDRIVELVTGIFEASNFQDITGQRITKVVTTLKHIEVKIDAMLNALGREVERVRSQADAAETKAAAENDKDLLNGPQLPGSANDQAEIDRLLASFD